MKYPNLERKGFHRVLCCFYLNAIKVKFTKNERDINILLLNKEGWNRLADVYDKNNPVCITTLFKRFVASLPVHGRVLDAGCGTGIPLSSYLVERGFDLTGIDIAPRMVAIASRNVPTGKFIEMSLSNITWDGTFDGVVASYSMLLLDPRQFKESAKRIGRALQTNGYLYLSLNENVDQEAVQDEDTFIEIAGVPIYSRTYTEQEVTSSFGDGGMNVIELHKRTINSFLFGEEHMMEFLMQKEP